MSTPNPSPTASSTASPVGSPPGAWAEVRAHQRVMRYRRAGASGRPVLVLGAEAPDACWPELAERLTSDFRLILPELPPRADAVTWLLHFLDGLGLDRVAVVALERGMVPALELALLDGDRVRRLVLVPAGDTAETGLDGSLGTAGRDTPIPLLVVRRALPATEAVQMVSAFLGAEALHRVS